MMMMMETKHFLKLSLFFLYVASSLLPLDVCSGQPPGCALNVTPFRYHPAGECLTGRRKLKGWGSLPTTTCCRNALTVLSLLLAGQAVAGERKSVFIEPSQWQTCNLPSLFQMQPSVSVDSCGFNDLFYGSGECSRLSFLDFDRDESYREAAGSCHGFGSDFDRACGNCSAAMLKARDSLMKKLGVGGNDTEKAVCGVAVVVSLASERLNDSYAIDELYGCLRALDVFDPGYVKLTYSLVQTLVGIVLASIGLMLVIALAKYVTNKKTKEIKERKIVDFQVRELPTWTGLYRFSKAEIENAMNFCGEKQCLGQGSAGEVYKGILPSGQAVAIKHIDKGNTSDTFDRELEGLTRVRHPNLVCLFGCCTEDGEQYLVYEYCPAGNLAQHLLRRDTVLTWEKRVKILRDCALALKYLHHFIDGCIVHRDIKLTNILLTDNLDPKLSDFGLAKVLGMEESKVFTDVRGTIGYMDPEYMSNAKLTCASDIYSFGIVTLQLLSGQKVFELDLEARDQLTRKAKDVSLRKRALKDFEDPRLDGKVNSADFDAILQIAVLCVAKSSKGRPTIGIVFNEMDKAWKNTLADMRMREGNSSIGAPQPRSIDVLPL